MGCCKCEEYEWDDPQPSVYADPAGVLEYCRFHAPKDEKWKDLVGQEKYSAEEFNSLVFVRINDCIDKVVAGDTDAICVLAGTIFPGSISFSLYDKNNPLPRIDLSWTSFSDEAVFVGTKFSGDAIFYNATFDGDVRFNAAIFIGEALFNRTTFGGVALFTNATFYNMALFHGCQANTHSIHMHLIRKQSLEYLSFSPSELPAFSFRRCDWPLRLGIEIRGDGKRGRASEELYRAMKQHALEEHDQLQASRWHYREKLMAMKRGENSAFEQAMLWLYFACSGFGERAGQSLLVLLALVVLSFALNAMPQPMDWNTLWGAAAANATLATIPFAKDIPGDGWVKVGRGFWQFLIAVQFTLFALAVRNRFRR